MNPLGYGNRSESAQVLANGMGITVYISKVFYNRNIDLVPAHKLIWRGWKEGATCYEGIAEVG